MRRHGDGCATSAEGRRQQNLGLRESPPQAAVDSVLATNDLIKINDVAPDPKAVPNL